MLAAPFYSNYCAERHVCVAFANASAWYPERDSGCQLYLYGAENVSFLIQVPSQYLLTVSISGMNSGDVPQLAKSVMEWKQIKGSYGGICTVSVQNIRLTRWELWSLIDGLKKDFYAVTNQHFDVIVGWWLVDKCFYSQPRNGCYSITKLPPGVLIRSENKTWITEIANEKTSLSKLVCVIYFCLVSMVTALPRAS